jgi:hypothetical protein
MRQQLLTLSFLLFSFIGFGQCPTEITLLQTQEDVDNFAIDYPNCTQLTRTMIIGSETSDVNDLSALSQLTQIGTPVGNGINLIISGTNLNSLSGLDNLEYVGGSLNIYDTGIINLTGLENLATIRDSFTVSGNSNLMNFIGVDVLSESGSLSVSNNISQTSFEGMEAFQGTTYGSGDIQIADLDNLISIEGLNNVSQIKQLRLLNCDALLSLDPFENLIQLGSVIIRDNDSLASITGLSNVDPETVFYSLSISNCPNLSYCSINLFCENFDNTNPNVVIFIENNALGCNTPQEVQIECGNVNIPDTNFLSALLFHSPTIDTNGDDNIQFTEAEAFTGTLDVSEEVISDFTGLEAFVNITGFNGRGNFMSTLSLESNTALTSVDFSESPDLENVNLKNGNNTDITGFNGLDCPTLEFVCVDDVAFAEANYTNIDPQVEFVENCEVLAVAGSDLGNAVTIFPNPVSNTLQIEIINGIAVERVTVYSIVGERLQSTWVTSIDFSDLSPGVYFVEVLTDRGNIIKKIIKQ